jgi:site-specific recombinase XerC
VTISLAGDRALARASRSVNARPPPAQDLLEDGHDIRTVEELLGHADVSTTMTYLHVIRKRGI